MAAAPARAISGAAFATLLLIVAAILGDSVNYSVGTLLGQARVHEAMATTAAEVLVAGANLHNLQRLELALNKANSGLDVAMVSAE